MKGDITNQTTVIVEIPRATNGRIVGLSGSFKDREWVISRTPFVFGRLDTSDVNLENEVGTSRRHAEIASEGPYYTITDFSSNGTVINGVRIAKGAVHPLRHSDVITICTNTFLFVQGPVVSVDPPSAAAADAPQPTDIFDVSALAARRNQGVDLTSADELGGGVGSDEVPALEIDEAALLVVGAAALDALARAARIEDEALKLKAGAELELARARAEAEDVRQESRRIRASVEHQGESRAALETELAAMRQKIEDEVRARAEAEALARVQAEAQARAQAQAAAEVELRNQLESQRQELERLRAESHRFSAPAAESSTVSSSSNPVETTSAPALTDARPASNPLPEGEKKTADSSLKTRDSLPSTPENAAYQFNLDDRVILVLSSDNLRGETLCTPAHLTSIGRDGRLTLSCVDSVSSFWINKTVLIGKDPERGSLLTAEARVLSTSEDASRVIVLSNTVGRLKSVQLRSSVRQLAIPELQTFARADGKPAELIDYSIGGVAIAVEKSESCVRGDVIVGTLRLKRTLVFDVTLEVRGRHPSPQRDDRDILNCRFSLREMDAEVLRAISMAVLYRR